MHKHLLSQQELTTSAGGLAEQLMKEILIAAQISPTAIKFPENAFGALDFGLGTSILPLISDTYSDTGELQGPDRVAWDFCLVGTGRVRLLCRDDESPRDFTVCRLNTGQWFGADSLLYPQAWSPYRVIGASHGQVFRLSPDLLQQWLEAYPALAEYLTVPMRQYQRVIFFRTQTPLKVQPGPQIRALAEKTCDRIIPAHTSLALYAEAYPGRFWLRRGTIDAAHGNPPAVGESWGYGVPVPTEWQAQTDLWVHHLPAEACEASGIAALASAPGQLGVVKLGQTKRVANPSPALLARDLLVSRNGGRLQRPSESTYQTPLETPRASTPAVVFPRPIRRQLLDRLNRFPWIEQQSSSDCGVACLAMLACYWGKRLPINVLRERANVGRSGASLKGLARAAESIGFLARPVRASLERIAEQSNPWIAHWQGDHYVVVYKIDPRQVTLADPAVGRRVISRDEFKTYWTGYALLIEPTERFEGVDIKQSSLGRYINLLIPYRPLILQIVLVSLLIQLFTLVTPLFTQIILDRVVVQKSMSTLNVFAVGLLMFSVWSIAMTAVRGFLLAYFSTRLDLTMVSGFIKHAISLPLRFYESRRVGDIVTRVQENQKIQRFLVGQVMLAWLGFLTGFVYLGLMLYYNLTLALVVLALIPPIVLITLISTPFLRRISRQVFKEAANQNSTLVEMINGISAVKSAGVEQEVRWRWEDALARLQNAIFKGHKFNVGLEALNGTVNTLGNVALLWIGAAMVIQDQLTIGQFVAFNMMIGYVLNPVVTLANLWDELQEIFISVERLNDVFETQPEEALDQPMLVLPPMDGEVAFEKVTFRYDEDADHNTLENLTFRVEPGQTIAIVGRSGSGKTTLVKLLEGLYHPNQGQIFIDGHDIRHVSPYSLRTQLGVVPQECFLFSGTILENITLYRQDCTLKQTVEAAKLAEAHAFIQSFPLGYNTKVGERGSTLSGGQRQRIAIARALLGNPRILVLDEATSSLDTESERRFQRNLAQLSRDRTTFIIAHRLSTVRNVDRILVLDKGVLVEQGTHQELIELRGLYHSLAQQQLDI